MLAARDVAVTVAGEKRILGPVSLTVAPGSLVALMGTSGSGKSTLIHVLAGLLVPSAGEATWGGSSTAEAIRSFGYVPQRETVHDRLTTREALECAARLRLDADAPIESRVSTVLEELDLTAQADTLIRHLSGGERRRAACGLELVGDPPVLLLDEPTSGLDAVLERRLMATFRRLADDGRVVIVATHASASLDLCDGVLVLDSGTVAYRGGPEGAREHLASVARGSIGRVPEAGAAVPEPAMTPLSSRRGVEAETARAARPFALELRVLAVRQARTLMRDRRTLAVLLGQAPLIGLLIAIVFPLGTVATNASPLDAIEVVFLLMTGAIWLGVTSSCREVVKERGLVEREFDVGVRLDAYILAKALVLFALNFVGVLLLTMVVVALQPLGAGSNGVVEVFVLALLTSWASVAMGLAVSCLARTPDQAAGLVPLLLIPQLLLAGGLIPLAQMPRAPAALANLVLARWSYAGLASAARVGVRLSQYSASSALGFSTSFFSLAPATAAVILVAFTLVGLFAAILVLMVRPSVK